MAALTAGLIGPMLHGIDTSTPLGFAEKAFGHALVGGVLSGGANEFQGGSFRDGFLGAFVSQLASPYIGQIGGADFEGVAVRVAASAVVGGTAAELGGGKFANGAVSAAFLRLFNDEKEIARRMAEEYAKESAPREINAWFNKKEGWLWIGNYRTGESITLTGFSGGSYGSAPAPDGVYSIVADPKATEGWFGLFRHDGVEINDQTRIEGVGIRDGIRFHMGTISIGCVTITCEPQQWAAVQGIVYSGLDQRVLSWRYGGDTEIFYSTSYGKLTVK